MIEHVVLFKIKAGVTSGKIMTMIKALEDLQNEIPQLAGMHAGINFSERNKGYGVMLISRFRTREDLAIYSAHAAHKRVIEEYIHPIREEVIVGDIEY